MTDSNLAPEWQVSRWFNSTPLTLAGLRGKVVVAHAFQMLCPGCAMTALPQMQRLHAAFPPE
ncbi:MAG TPA: TlpA family protein disulfide reductase, partial [Rhodanobacter sp.]|nr:TlpA family protein disulfide reductase [Rhodanobacter sp.]